jgi:type III secretion system HrpE/YscL family protein
LAKVIKQGPQIAYPSSRPSGGPSHGGSGGPPLRSSPISGDRGSLSPKKAIIQKEVVDATADGRRIIAAAEQQAAQMIDDAERQVQEIRDRAHDEGYQEGLGQHTEAIMRASIELKRLREAVEAEYVKLVRTCVEKLLGQEIKLHPDAVVGIVRNALRDAGQQREIIVRVHPSSAEEVRKNHRRLLDVLARANQVEVREDPSVSPGGCIVVTELGTIDASLERQLQAIEAALDLELQRGGGDDGEEPGEDEEPLLEEEE